jgi:hypothetical protein
VHPLRVALLGDQPARERGEALWGVVVGKPFVARHDHVGWPYPSVLSQVSRAEDLDDGTRGGEHRFQRSLEGC